MPAFIDLTGQQFERLTVVRRHPERKDNRTQWICQCCCKDKTIVTVLIGSLRSGATQSCGCLQKERVVEANTTHGLYNSREYRAWAAIKDRCYNPSNEHYKSYGGRGITMCDEWKESFEAFYQDMGPRPSLQHSIDRVENDKNYCKDNCRWATKIEQANNRRTNILYTRNGVTKSLADWCREFDINYSKTQNRISRMGWTFEEAIQPIESKLITFEGEIKTLLGWCDVFDLRPATTALRIMRGESFENIVSE